MPNRISLLLLSLVLSASISLGVLPVQTEAQTIAQVPLNDSQAIIDVYRTASPAVVNISYSREERDALGRRIRRETTGSGFIIDQLGHVLTNQHVINDPAVRVDVTVADGTVYAGRMVAQDRANDLALLRLEASPEQLAQLTPAVLGDSSALQVGQIVLAIGNPFGLERSASLGIVSSLGRTRPGVDKRFISDMIQTDAAINPGNSGGPLLNMAGEVVGINEQIEASTESGGNVGIGFAIPINTVKRYLPDLLAGREPSHAWMGITGVSLTPTRAERLGLSTQQGVILAALATDGPAAQAGLQAVQNNNASTGDIITNIDNLVVNNFQDIARAVDRREPGDVVTVQYMRGGEKLSMRVTLGIWQPTESTAY